MGELENIPVGICTIAFQVAAGKLPATGGETALKYEKGMPELSRLNFLTRQNISGSVTN